MDEDLDKGHEVSFGLASLWLGVALGPLWPNISKCSTPANSLGSYCPWSPHGEDTMLTHKSLETDLPLGSGRRPLCRAGTAGIHIPLSSQTSDGRQKLAQCVLPVIAHTDGILEIHI